MLCNLLYTCCICDSTLLVHHIETFLVVLLLSGNISFMLALAGQLSSHVHLRWRQFGICRQTVRMDCRDVCISLEVGLQRTCLG